jgi:hypothetical protein
MHKIIQVGLPFFFFLLGSLYFPATSLAFLRIFACLPSHLNLLFSLILFTYIPLLPILPFHFISFFLFLSRHFFLPFPFLICPILAPFTSSLPHLSLSLSLSRRSLCFLLSKTQHSVSSNLNISVRFQDSVTV